MYQPSNAMPISNYSVVQPSTQQKTFSENNICRFSIPFNSIPFFDPHSSYLQLNMEVDATSKMELNLNSSVVIKYIRLSVNGNVLEEVDEFNQLAHIYNHYGHDDSSRSHEAVFTNDPKEIFTAGLMGNQSVAVASGVRKTKLIIPMKECGLFSSLEVVPLMAFGDNLDVEIRFAPNDEVLRHYSRDGQQTATGIKNRIKRTLLPVSTTIANASTPTFLDLQLPYKGWTSVGDIPLQVGERVKLLKQDLTQPAGAIGGTEMVITAIARAQTSAITDNPNVVRITFTNAQAIGETLQEVAGQPSAFLELVKDTANSATPTINSITYSNVEWYIQKVVPPAQYVDSLKKQLASPNGFQYDIHTWTCYKGSLLQAVKSQTIEIPAYQSRAKSVLVIPRLANQTVQYHLDNGQANATYKFEGQFANMKDYQFQVNNGLRVPTRPVNLDVMNGSFRHLSAEHLIQLSQALGASNVGVRAIKDSLNHFVIGRQLSKYGGTTRLNSAMRVYCNWTDDTDPVDKLQPITFVNHINRVAVNSQGLQVFN